MGVRGFLVGAEAQIFLDGEFWKDLAALRDAGNAGGDHLVRWQPGDVGSIECDPPSARGRQSEDGPDQRGLA